MIFHTLASSFLFANGKVPRTKIEKKHLELAVAKCGKIGKCLPCMSQHSGFVCFVLFCYFLASGWVRSVNLSPIHQGHLLRGSTKILSEVSRQGFFRASPWLEVPMRFLALSKSIQESKFCFGLNMFQETLWYKHSRTMSMWVQRDFGTVGSACSSSLDLYGSREWPPCWSKEYSEY